MRGEKPIVKEVGCNHRLSGSLSSESQDAPFPDWAIYLQSSDGKGQREHEQWRIEPQIWGRRKDSHIQTQVRLISKCRLVRTFEIPFLKGNEILWGTVNRNALQEILLPGPGQQCWGP